MLRMLEASKSHGDSRKFLEETTSLRYKVFLNLTVIDVRTHSLHKLRVRWALDSWPRWTVITRLWRRPRFRKFYIIYVLVRSALLRRWSVTGDTTSDFVRLSTTE